MTDRRSAQSAACPPCALVGCRALNQLLAAIMAGVLLLGRLDVLDASRFHLMAVRHLEHRRTMILEEEDRLAIAAFDVLEEAEIDWGDRGTSTGQPEIVMPVQVWTRPSILSSWASWRNIFVGAASAGGFLPWN